MSFAFHHPLLERVMQLIRSSVQRGRPKSSASLPTFFPQFVASFRCFDCSSGESAAPVALTGCFTGGLPGLEGSCNGSVDPLKFTFFEKLEVRSGETHGERRPRLCCRHQGSADITRVPQKFGARPTSSTSTRRRRHGQQ